MTTASQTCYADAATYRTATIVHHARIAQGTWRLRLDCPDVAAAAAPGQFAMLRIPQRQDPLLARPLAVYDTYSSAAVEPGRLRQGDDPARYVDFIYAVHGRFTTALQAIPAGRELAVWGPLGNGFHVPTADHLVLVAGGIGQTALLALGRELTGQASYGPPTRPAVGRVGRVSVCWGARHSGLFGGIEDFRAAGFDVHQATLDGSAGLRGTVVDLLESRFGGAAAGMHVACCGPDPMMAAVAGWTGARGISCDVSLEAPMACGIGICFTCVARIRDGNGGWDYRRTCVEGPVFAAHQVVW